MTSWYVCEDFVPASLYYSLPKTLCLISQLTLTLQSCIDKKRKSFNNTLKLCLIHNLGLFSYLSATINFVAVDGH